MMQASNLVGYRIPESLSPSALTLFRRDPKEYFYKYLATIRPPKFPQTKPMSVGSAFDARVKSYLANVFGNTEWSFERLFESQVEVQNRDYAREAGENVFKVYRDSGALAELVLSLKGAINVRFEERTTRLINGVNITGVPDLLFETNDCLVILDWKVNGYERKTSPRKGYVLCLPDRVKHKDVVQISHYGVPIVSEWFNTLYPDWAMQLCTYIWLMGYDIGSRCVCMVHQITPPRVSIHAGLCAPQYQEDLFAEYLNLWNGIRDGSPFPDWENLEKMAAQLQETTFNDLVRGTNRPY
jgi:hypothetical protein